MSYPESAQQNNTTLIVMNNKSTFLAYVLWFFLGSLGVHRFYLGSTFMGLCQLGLTILGWVTSFILLGWLFFIPLGIWLIVDIFWIPMRTGKLQNNNMAKMMSVISK